MQTRSPTWQSLFNGAHKTEYKYVINGVDYLGDKIKDTAVITKPLLEKPAIGRTCTARKRLPLTHIAAYLLMTAKRCPNGYRRGNTTYRHAQDRMFLRLIVSIR